MMDQKGEEQKAHKSSLSSFFVSFLGPVLFPTCQVRVVRFYVNWYNSDAAGYTGYQQYPQQLALPAPPAQQAQTGQENTAPTIHSIHTMTSAVHQHSMTAAFVNAVHSDNKVEIMIDSGAATHVCPTWFAPDSPLYTFQQGQGPNLRTATDEKITIHGYKWVLMTKQHNYQLAVPFYVCDVKIPIMSVTRLTEQGFDIQFKDNQSNNVTRQRLLCQLGTTSRTLLPTNAASEHPRQHET